MRMAPKVVREDKQMTEISMARKAESAEAKIVVAEQTPPIANLGAAELVRPDGPGPWELHSVIVKGTVLYSVWIQSD